MLPLVDVDGALMFRICNPSGKLLVVIIPNTNFLQSFTDQACSLLFHSPFHHSIQLSEQLHVLFVEVSFGRLFDPSEFRNHVSLRLSSGVCCCHSSLT